MNITRDEWLQALGAAVEPVVEAPTCQELAKQFSLNRRTMLARLHALLDAGKARKVVTIRDGRRVAGWVLVKGKKR